MHTHPTNTVASGGTTGDCDTPEQVAAEVARILRDEPHRITFTVVAGWEEQ